jgi:hypothetical protein
MNLGARWQPPAPIPTTIAPHPRGKLRCGPPHEIPLIRVNLGSQRGVSGVPTPGINRFRPLP